MAQHRKIRSTAFMTLNWFLIVVGIGAFGNIFLWGDQITINRIESMPALPEPFEMRDWTQVTSSYTELVLDETLTGQWLPLVWIDNAPQNYPEHPSFGLHTVVGTTVPFGTEAINVLPALVGASLAGLEMTDYLGLNWILMAEEYFNNRPEEMVYLNSPHASSGDDWWYDTMPNIFFYRLASMYPDTGHFEEQKTSVAQRWLTALDFMGGSTCPWAVPDMDYRAWHLATMTPNQSGVHEPEAAGALAWILYLAYTETGHEPFRIGAEWAMEFLTSQVTNPSYELQLPYGAFIASRMNAELGTDYDTEQLVNWCFNMGPLRNWGAVLGSWGGYDCDGLIGQIMPSNYAFLMNTFEQIGALVPLVRYDDRFARAIGRWVLNAANACRLFYPAYLPDTHQDSEAWSHQYDPDSAIGHEALRQSWAGYSPYATGDAISGGWGSSNLSLYSSSHVGILGGIIQSCDVPEILILDLLKTDYFRPAGSYPTYLIYNPFDEERSITLPLEAGQVDIYDAVTNTFLAYAVADEYSLTIPGDAARVIVLPPTAGIQSQNLNQLQVNGITVDYNLDTAVENHPPRIKALALEDSLINSGETVPIYLTVQDLDDDPADLVVSLSVTSGALSQVDSQWMYTAPDSSGFAVIIALVSDNSGASDSATVSLEVTPFNNTLPWINDISAHPRKVDLNGFTQLTCNAEDPDGTEVEYMLVFLEDTLSYGQNIYWNRIAPDTPGDYNYYCYARDAHGGVSVDSLSLMVRDFSQYPTGNLIMHLPFSGNGQDESGNGHHGMVFGPILTEDMAGNSNEAYLFDGSNDYIRVSNTPEINFGSGISVHLIVLPDEFFEREAYPISHGNWEHRWKISITNRHLRWTVRTDSPVNNGITDLDSDTILELDRFYHVVCTYTGEDLEIWVDGELDAFTSWSGELLSTSYDLTIGQVLPGNSNYNYSGVLDEIRLYDYGLSVGEIQVLAPINSCDTFPGDLNCDSFLDIVDIVMMVAAILEIDGPSPEEHQQGDINSDGFLDILDIVEAVIWILENPSQLRY